MSKALGLLSGGLDSTLAALALQRQGIDVTCIAFVTPFFGAAKAQKAALRTGIPLITRDIGEVHLEVVKNPVHGYGKNMNPCIDCHALMFRLAAEVMAEEGFDFLFSGEVLGQRPMSQNLSALGKVAAHSGVPDRILRPLSARLLPPTAMEERGMVDRERLLDIQGRSRTRQEELARQWGLAEYPSSGGGCLLTEKSFAGRLRDLFSHQPDCVLSDIELLKLGRQIRLSPSAKVVIGRNQEDNAALQSFASPDDFLLRAAAFNGPTALLRGTPSEEDLRTAAAAVVAYGKGQGEKEAEVLVRRGKEDRRVAVSPLEREKLRVL